MGFAHRDTVELEPLGGVDEVIARLVENASARARRGTQLCAERGEEVVDHAGATPNTVPTAVEKRTHSSRRCVSAARPRRESR